MGHRWYELDLGYRLLLGLERSVQICPLSSSVSQILNAAVFAAYEEGALLSEG